METNMRYMINLLCLLLSLGSFAVYAATIPSDVLGAQKYDSMQCISDFSQTCVVNVCPRSTERDCPENCRRLAEDKCRNKTD